MKIRNGFVSNSSSTSFVIISAGGTTILEDGDSDSCEASESVSIDIDKLITLLQEAKKNGATKVDVYHGGGYEG